MVVGGPEYFLLEVVNGTGTKSDGLYCEVESGGVLGVMANAVDRLNQSVPYYLDLKIWASDPQMARYSIQYIGCIDVCWYIWCLFMIVFCGRAALINVDA